MIANSERTAFSYDAFGYVAEERDVKNNIINAYTNDVNGNRKRLEVKDNGTVVMTADYTYDILDRLTNVSFDGGSASVSYTYDANGNMLTETKNGDVTEYAYNAAGLLKTQTGGDSPDYTMTYSLDGNKVGETDSVNGYRSYVYDGIGQLKNETLSNNGIVNSSISYTYDTRGNRTSSNKNGTICNYTYDRNNRLINDDNGIRTNNYAYDNNGNLVSRMSGTYIDSDKAVAETASMNVFGTSASQASDISNSTAVYYTYDAVNKLKEIQSDDGMVATYGYDAKGRRISKTVNGITTTQIWDGDYIIREKDSEGTETSRYYRARNLVANNSSDAVNYYGYDPHGSVVSIGNKTYTYDAFGNQTNDNADDTNPFRYNGEYFDNETGYIYLRARYYDPSIGRFTTQDPIKDGLNWYVYCSNNPVMFVDPSGYLNQGYDANGNWHDWDAEEFGADSAKYQMLVGLTTAYENASSDEYRERISYLADTLRVTDTLITDAILLNNSSGANTFGHNALALLNSYGQAFVFSYYADPESSLINKLYDVGEMRFSVLSVEELNELKDVNGILTGAVTVYGECRTEFGDAAYDRFVWEDIISASAGESMFKRASEIFNNPGTYRLFGNQCDNIANEILSYADSGYSIVAYPNTSYERFKVNRTHWRNQNGANRGVKI